MSGFAKESRLILLFLLVTGSKPALSCPYHDLDTGELLPGFTHRQFYHPSQFGSISDVSIKKWVKLVTPSMITSRLHEKIDIKLDYVKYTQEENVQITLEAEPEISVVDVVQVETDENSGSYTFTIIASKAGLYRLSLIANVTETDSKRNYRETVYLHSIKDTP